jgi:hypothetical protein
MASLYIRGSYYWLTFKDGDGKWRQHSTKLRTDIPAEADQAIKLCDAHSARERRVDSPDYVNVKALEWQRKTDQLYPSCAGIYMLWLEREIIYIGKAKTIRNRVSWHALDKKAFDEVSFIPVPNEAQRDYLESVLIDFLRPKLNKVMPIVELPTPEAAVV